MRFRESDRSGSKLMKFAQASRTCWRRSPPLAACAAARFTPVAGFAANARARTTVCEGLAPPPSLVRQRSEAVSKRTEAELHRQRGLRALPIVYGRDNHMCVYCGRKTVLVRRIPEKRRIGYVNNGLEFKFIRPGGKKNRVMPVATVDHIVPISHGGQSYLSNLALCCVACNRGRNEKLAQASEAPNDV